MATNMYRVGDYVYVETSPNSPYLIRRVEELNKNQSGNVEAKVMCFYRRRDLPNPLVQLADKHQLLCIYISNANKCICDIFQHCLVAAAEDSPLAMKLKRTWLRTPVGEEQAAQAVLDPSIAALDDERTSPVNITITEKLTGGNNASLSADKGEHLTAKQRYQIKHRELFLSRQVESIPATQIRGKCSVTLLNETESLQSYLNKDDTFFYCLVFDPTQKTLLADKGEIRVGSRYQSEISPKLKDLVMDDRKLEDLETLIWTSNHSLTDRKIDQFLVVSRSIGTFARALDCSSSVKQPSLHMSAAAASRDITLFHAMDTLHKHNYSIEEAMCSLVPSTGPVLCRDEIEDWSASEANLFEEALDKYGKDFNDIRRDFLPWKTLKQIIEYYYMWKTTDRYVQQKRVKAVEAELKLKQVYVPQYNLTKSGTSSKGANIYNGTTNNAADVANMGKPCESCSAVKSAQWFPWSNGHLLSRLCQSCWDYWKKYAGLKNCNKQEVTQTDDSKRKSGDDEEKVSDLSSRQLHKCSIVNCGKEFKLKTHLARHYTQAHGIAISSGSPRPIMKTRTAFYLQTNPMTRLALNTRIAIRPGVEIKKLLLLKKKERGSVTKIANRLGSPGIGPHEWLILTPKDKLPKPDVVSFPKPPKASDGSLLYDRIPNKIVELEKDLTIIPSPAPSSLRKRVHEEAQLNGTEVTITPTGPPTKRPNKDPMPSHCPSPEQFAAIMAASGQPLPRHHLNGKPKIAQMARTGNGRKQVISWMDAPDDVYFRATEASKKARKILLPIVLKRAARKPWPTPLPQFASTSLSLPTIAEKQQVQSQNKFQHHQYQRPHLPQSYLNKHQQPPLKQTPPPFPYTMDALLN
uniref:Metastasis-associated protein MTA3 n=1 Tax=Glossina brevipalpis TaxID=37001 RepID=A0A1A9W705_9MUSC